MGMSGADNTVNIWQNLPISNPKPDLLHINAHTKCGENPLTFTRYHPEMKIWACLGQITLSKFDDICPLAIPNQITTISIHIPNLVKIHSCLLKLSSGNKIRTDRRSNRWTFMWPVISTKIHKWLNLFRGKPHKIYFSHSNTHFME